MARVITALQTQVASQTSIIQHAVFWIPVPAEFRPLFANPAFTSALTGQLAPTTQELALLRSGQYREVEDAVIVSIVNGQGAPLSLETIKANLGAALSARYDALAEQTVLNDPYVLYGSTKDPNGGWTIRSLRPASG